MWGGILGGGIRVIFGGLGGLLAWDGRVFRKGLIDIASAFGGAILGVEGKAITYLQSPFEERRRLTRGEKDLLYRVYRRSLALYNIRVVPGQALIFHVNDAPFTLGNTIYLKGNYSEELLVHEAAHVWQYQNRGVRYLADAVGAQWFIGRQTAYDWEREYRHGRTRWQDFNAEAQAELLDDIYAGGSLGGNTGGGIFYNEDPVANDARFSWGEDYTELAKSAVAYVRGALSLRLSHLGDSRGEAVIEVGRPPEPEIT